MYPKIDYLEIPAKDLQKTESFFAQVFNWNFKYYGTEYLAFFDENINGGFYKTSVKMQQEQGSALIVFYYKDLEHIANKIEQYGGTVKPKFKFPGGSRFHFIDPNGNEFAIWSEIEKS